MKHQVWPGGSNNKSILAQGELLLQSWRLLDLYLRQSEI